MAARDRYKLPDDYVTAELLAQMKSCRTSLERSALLERTWSRGSVPDEVVRWAAQDAEVVFRWWLARYAPFLPREIESSLTEDPEPVVRAALLENSKLTDYFPDWKVPFSSASRFERLGLVRNSMIGLNLVADIFDPGADLGIDDEERRHLILAFLTNPVLSWGYAGVDAIDTGDDAYAADTLKKDHTASFQKLWKQACAWTGELATLRGVAFECLPCRDRERAERYAVVTDHYEHRSLLAGADSNDILTLRLGLMDSEPACRLAALEHLGMGHPLRGKNGLEQNNKQHRWTKNGPIKCALIMVLCAGVGEVASSFFGWSVPGWGWAVLGALAYLTSHAIEGETWRRLHAERIRKEGGS